MERLQRVLAERGVASRRKAEELIRAGRVTVDGRVITELGTKVDPERAEIRVNGKLIRPQPKRYILLNKPSGYITTTKDERNRRTVMDIVQVPERIYPVGRLDRDTSGLLLLTNDGELANRIMHPRYGLEKEYHVLTPVRPSPASLEKLRKGIVIDGSLIVPREVRLLRETPEGVLIKVVVHEGKYHLVRRLMDAAGIPVERLRRVRLGPLSIAGLPVGAWRDLTPGELATLFEAVHLDREPSPLPRRQQPRIVHRRQPSHRSTDAIQPKQSVAEPEREIRASREPATPRHGHWPVQSRSAQEPAQQPSQTTQSSKDRTPGHRVPRGTSNDVITRQRRRSPSKAERSLHRDRDRRSSSSR
jgi:23S rRNA pseudouridine2605 synthase